MNEVLHVDREFLERALLLANDACARYWCWLRKEYEEADRLRCEISAMLGEPRERRKWPV